MLRFSRIMARRALALLPSPNNFSKITRGLFSLGSGVVSFIHAKSVDVEAAVAVLALADQSSRSMQSSSDGSTVSFPSTSAAT